MLSKISIVITLLALLIQFAVAATPPACVIRAVGESDQSPTDIKDICGSGSTVEQILVSDCGNDLDAAMSAFSSICSRAGVTISTWAAATAAGSTNAVTSVKPSSAMTAGIKSESASTAATASLSGTKSAIQSAGVTVTTATNTNTHTDAVISTPISSQSSGELAAASSTSAPSTGAADHIEMSGLVMSVIIAAGIALTL
ncbi:hypothetical protein E4T39_05164 [Aureobasidium subglaciale]|nr:hypothetical protein E4T39_05164 [Aureobasidium subglaciale]